MPTELRKLHFSPEETLAAALAYGQRTGLSMPLRRTPALTITGDPRARVRLHFPEEYQTGGQLFLFDDRQMLGALILYCREKRIPLPRQGAKTVRADSGGLQLLTRIQRHGPARRRAA